MIWTELDFGKHEGLTLPQLLFRDPDYFFYAVASGYFRKGSWLAAEAEELHQRATSIRIPGDGDVEELEIEHAIHYPSLKYQGFLVVPASKPSHPGSSQTFRRDRLDMSIPRQLASYDKTGGKLLIKHMKPVYFASANARLTKQVCEAFFECGSNFYLD